MKKQVRTIFICYLLCGSFHDGLAQDAQVSRFQTGSYIPGLISVRDFSNPVKSGVLLTNYNAFLFSNRFNDSNGNAITSISSPSQNVTINKVDIRSYNNILDITYVSPKLKFLNGIRYMAYIDLPYSTTSIQVAATGLLKKPNTLSGGASGFNDITVSPLTLSYSFSNFDITFGYSFVAPTGHYKTGDNSNTGLGYWSHIFQIGGYYYLNNKSTAFLVLPTYEFHGKLKDADVTVGDRVALEYGISQYLTEKIELTLQAGHMWQTGRDKGASVYWNTSIKDKFSVISAGAGYWFISDTFYSHLKWISSYGSREFFQFNGIEVQLLVVL
ncbi:Uncharacterized conserved protein [Bizionia echini]|uniref:Uncharacterized conserved protein n=1 Tax=Bizionia echini TaxID=649333 RepID=A0A1I4ZYS3_9FLAO|nr:transporter [Bizionia echini]SFN55342.1 Uncharacterized conserved protein [Bizionia echini]